MKITKMSHGDLKQVNTVGKKAPIPMQGGHKPSICKTHTHPSICEAQACKGQ